MKNRLQFQEKLSGILTLAEDQGKRITTQEVDAYFESDQLTKDQFDLVYDYLLSQKVVVKGYEKSGGMLKEKNREETIAYTEEEEKYLQIYEQDLQGIPKEKEGEREKLLGQVMN
ncbi:MAG: RNA polymerase sigma factor region1.1 domain-containing protein, partial [Lachnospiraceae bacterium]